MTRLEIGYGAALLAGMISVSPCVLPLVPGCLSFIAGEVTMGDAAIAASSRQRWWLTPLTFVAGFSVIFVLIGAGAGLLGELLLQYRTEAGVVGGAIVTVFGLFMAGVIQPPWLGRTDRARRWIAARSRRPGCRLRRGLDALHRPRARQHSHHRPRPREVDPPA